MRVCDLCGKNLGDETGHLCVKCEDQKHPTLGAALAEPPEMHILGYMKTLVAQYEAIKDRLSEMHASLQHVGEQISSLGYRR